MMIRLDRETSLDEWRRLLRRHFSVGTAVGAGRSTPDRDFAFIDLGFEATVRDAEAAAQRRFGLELILLDASGIRCRADDRLGECSVPRERLEANDVAQVCRLIQQLGASREYADADHLGRVLDSWCPRAETPEAFAQVARCVAGIVGAGARWGRSDLFQFLDRHASSPDRRIALVSAATEADALITEWVRSSETQGRQQE